jgi:sugar lactone lactonase YvrE
MNRAVSASFALAVLAFLANFSICLAQETSGLSYPRAVAAGKQDWYVLDRNLPGVWRVHDGSLDILVQGSKKNREPLNAPQCLTVAADGTLYVGDSATRDVYKIETGKDPVPLFKGEVGNVSAIVIGTDGTLYLADLESNMILKGSSSGGKLDRFADRKGVRGLALDSEEKLWVLASTEPQLVRYASDKPDIMAAKAFRYPAALSVRGVNEWYVADSYDACIYMGTDSAAPSKLVCGEPLKYPAGIALIGDKDLVIADPHAKTVWKWAGEKLEVAAK